MKRILFVHAALPCLALALLLSGCTSNTTSAKNPAAEAPPPAKVEHVADAGRVKVEHPDEFPLATAAGRDTAPELNVTGTVSPDVSRNVPVISLASGRVVELNARIGDQVVKGQLLMRVQSADISAAFSDYRKAAASEILSRTQFDRARLLYEKGAIPQKDLEVAQDAWEKAKVDVETSREHLRVLGADADHPSTTVDIKAPVSGVITEQNVTAAAGVKTLDNSPNLFTISDLSEVWIICDVYENDLPKVHVGEYADVRLNAYPGKVFRARVDNIGPILDPNLRTAKVRLQMPNPGMMRIGMFVTATFHGQDRQMRAVVPASAVLHLHDREWVYVPAAGSRFQRVEVVGGTMLADNMQEIVSGIQPGQRVVSNALVLQNTVEQ
jgi:cobalt-zinc-cadmium efflux system membrane fusion protein